MTINQFPDGWYYDPFPIIGEHDWYGPYPTKAECVREYREFKRNWIGNFKSSEVCTGSKGGTANS